MRVYLASRYSRRSELLRYRTELEELGHQVTSRWLNGEHEIADSSLSPEAVAAERQRFAREDWDDVMAADCCICFTETPRATNSRGGRHVEFGAALAASKRVIAVGPAENLFYCLPAVERFDDWAECSQALRTEAMGAAAAPNRAAV